jgi:hypothetical protein
MLGMLFSLGKQLLKGDYLVVPNYNGLERKRQEECAYSACGARRQSDTTETDVAASTEPYLLGLLRTRATSAMHPIAKAVQPV